LVSFYMVNHTLMITRWRVLVVLILGLPFLISPATGSFSSIVQAGDEHCFSVRTLGETRSIISGNFDILDDELSPDPVSVSLYDDKFARVWKSFPSSHEATFSIFGLGRYTLCLENGLHVTDEQEEQREETEGWDGEPRHIGFSIRTSPLQRGEEPDKEGPDNKRTEELLFSTTQLSEGFNTLNDHQDYLKDREAKHRDLMEATFQKIGRWTFFEALILILVAGGQVLYLKKFFEQRINL